MPEFNPYQAPDFEPGLTKQHQLVARQLLKIHEQGPSYLMFLRMHLPWLILRSAPMVLTYFIIYSYGWQTAVPAMGGLIAFNVYIEFVYPRVLARTWAVYEKIIDWDKVQKLAE